MVEPKVTCNYEKKYFELVSKFGVSNTTKLTFFPIILSYHLVGVKQPNQTCCN
jgi:hypothetical protein